MKLTYNGHMEGFTMNKIVARVLANPDGHYTTVELLKQIKAQHKELIFLRQKLDRE